MSSIESQITNYKLIEGLAVNTVTNTNRDVTQVFLKDLALESESISFEKRSDYLLEKYKFSEELEKLITGEEVGQLLINYD